MKKTSQRSLLFRQNVNRTEEENVFRFELNLNLVSRGGWTRGEHHLEFHDFLSSKAKRNAINIGCDRFLEV